MIIKLHKNAKTSFALRSEIKEASGSINSLAVKYGLSWKTVRKWRNRNGVEDKSSRPHKLRVSLTQEQEDLILFERKKFKKTVEEIFFSVEGIIPNIYPVKIYRCLVRYRLSVLPDELLKAERRIRKFRKYTIGYLHIDALYTPKINHKRWYVFTCIDRVSKLGFVWITDRKTKENGSIFLDMVLKFYPYKINYILTDNGFEFTYKALVKKTKKIHPFDQICTKSKIQHRTIKFKHPWTNGMVERFNGKIINKVFKRFLFENVEDLNVKLTDYINRYNFEVKLKQLNYMTPSSYLKEKFNYLVQRIVI